MPIGNGKGVWVVVVLISTVAAHGLQANGLKRAADARQYAAFTKPLSKADRLHHALDRLTFGARPGDLTHIQQTGLKSWIKAQLYPEKQPENPLLERHLADLSSLRMSIHETYERYPPRQGIAAIAHGRAGLPEDPQLRYVTIQLAKQYLQTRDASPETSPASIAGDSSPDARAKLSSILTADQLTLLKSGTPDEKRRVLAAIPRSQTLDLALALPVPERRRLLSFAPVSLRRELMLTVNPENVVASDLAEGKILRAVYGSHQLAELLDDFWFNHFNVFVGKGADRYLVTSFERDAIRPNMFGNFYDLLLATAKSPAMLFYLDNWQSAANDARDAQKGNRKSRGLNENYGRELLELHTLGVDGGYTQHDVVEVARCFTGWTIANAQKGGGFEYNDKMHDKGSKIVLGHVIKAGGGMEDGIQVLDILAHHPSTAHFISLGLAQRFVADNPPPSLVERMSKTFLKSGGNLRRVVECMLSSREFWSQGAYRAKVKTPYELVVSAARATNAEVSSAYSLEKELQKMGEPLYRKVDPRGYSSLSADWVNSGALLERMNFALALAQDRVPNVAVDSSPWAPTRPQDRMAIARSVLNAEPSNQTRAAIAQSILSGDGQQEVPVGLVAGLALGSPEFQRH